MSQSNPVGPRILIVNQNWLGDVLFSTPAIRALRKRFPKVFLACLVPPRAAGVLSNNPYLDEVLPAGDRISPASPFEFAAMARRIRQGHFDTALFFHRSKTKVLLAKLAGVAERIGYAPARGTRFLTSSFPPPAKPAHKTDYFLQLLDHLDIPADGRELDFFPSAEAGAELGRLLENHGIEKNTRYAVVHAGGNWNLKRWPVESFIQWCTLFFKKYSWKIVLCGTSSEEELSRQITGHFSKGEVISLCGRTSLDTLALLLKRAGLLLSNDSGPIHLAASQKTPLVGLYGPTSPSQTGPVGEGPMRVLHKEVGCEVPCYFRSCNYRVCMEWITPEEAFAAAEELLA